MWKKFLFHIFFVSLPVQMRPDVSLSLYSSLCCTLLVRRNVLTLRPEKEIKTYINE